MVQIVGSITEAMFERIMVIFLSIANQKQRRFVLVMDECRITPSANPTTWVQGENHPS
jgi:hypothetical protein